MIRRRRSAPPPRRVLVIFCHPCTEGFVPAALDQVEVGLRASGAEVRLHDLYREGFVPELSAQEHRTHAEPGVAAELQEHADDLRWCDTLVLVYPTWWSGQPAMLKGWIDRVWASGVAWELPEGANRLRPTLHNVRHIVAVTSHGSSKLTNSFQGEGGKRTLFSQSAHDVPPPGPHTLACVLRHRRRRRRPPRRLPRPPRGEDRAHRELTVEPESAHPRKCSLAPGTNEHFSETRWRRRFRLPLRRCSRPRQGSPGCCVPRLLLRCGRARTG